jgi:hypothetical protein
VLIRANSGYLRNDSNIPRGDTFVHSGFIGHRVPGYWCGKRMNSARFIVTLYCNILRVCMGSHRFISSRPRGKRSFREALSILTR